VSQRLNAWRRWQAAAGPWRGYCICPALTVLESTVSESTLSPPRPPSLPVPGRKGGDFLRLFKEHTAVVVDLDPLVGVELAAEASQRRLAHVVLVLPRWPHANAVLPCGALAETLVTCSTLLTDSATSTNVVFVLDGERRTAVRRRFSDPRIDNRYDLALGDLPGLARLRAAGIKRVVKVCPEA